MMDGLHGFGYRAGLRGKILRSRSIACMEMLSNIWNIEPNSSARIPKSGGERDQSENNLKKKAKRFCF